MHFQFWRLMIDNVTSAAVYPASNSSFVAAVNKTFGSMTSMISAINAAGAARFGSGWSWLVYNTTSKRLVVLSTANQDVPIMGTALGYTDLLLPVLAVDVWEHAYYLKYGPGRATYMNNWWKVVNWQQVEINFLYVTNHKSRSDLNTVFNRILGLSTNIRS